MYLSVSSWPCVCCFNNFSHLNKIEILQHLKRCSEPKESGKHSALLTLGPKYWEMFRLSPSEIFALFVREKNIFPYCFSVWGSPCFMAALCGVGTTVTEELSSCHFCVLAVVNTGVLHECMEVPLIRLEIKLNLVHINWQVGLVMFFLRHLQPHFKVKTGKHKGEDLRHWFAYYLLTRRIIMCCGKLTWVSEAAVWRYPIFWQFPMVRAQNWAWGKLVAVPDPASNFLHDFGKVLLPFGPLFI